MPTFSFAPPAPRVPKYRKHKASGLAVVTIGGKDHYLGPHGTAASRREYDRLVAEWLAAGRPSCSREPDAAPLTVNELLARFWRHAKAYYVKNGEPTSELPLFRQALKPLRRLYGHTPARDFGPLALKAVQEALLASQPRLLARRTINGCVCRIRHVFRWAVANELVPPALAHGLEAVEGLSKGRTAAREPEPVRPVTDLEVQATLPKLPAIVADMVRFQRLTGCRPDEVCSIRPQDVDRSGDVWVYRPASHKTEHHGRERAVFIGPKAQDVLRPYLLRPADAFCFSPAESEAKPQDVA